MLPSLGSVRPMKRTADIVAAFEIAKEALPALQLVVAGDMGGSYGTKVVQQIAASSFSKDIRCVGRVGGDAKLQLLREAQVVAITSVKEGWCLVVTEANSQGTPAAVYNVDGLRDSVQNGKTGLVTTQNTPRALAQQIVALCTDVMTYETYRQNAWEWSKTITFEKCYSDFMNALYHV